MPKKKPAAAPSGSRPNILLTGYEPFDGATVNPSWEMVAPFDSQIWSGHNLVARQLPVIWGAPLANLGVWLRELNPVAVFSFGQGRPDGIYLEQRARQQRGERADNAGRTALGEAIAAGATEYRMPATLLAIGKTLTAQGYPIVLSENAGQYLCEECLYSLLYLQATEWQTTYVQFTHVPAFGHRIGPHNTEVTPAYLQQLVTDLLSAWAVSTGRRSP